MQMFLVCLIFCFSTTSSYAKSNSNCFEQSNLAKPQGVIRLGGGSLNILNRSEVKWTEGLPERLVYQPSKLLGPATYDTVAWADVDLSQSGAHETLILTSLLQGKGPKGYRNLLTLYIICSEKESESLCAKMVFLEPPIFNDNQKPNTSQPVSTARQAISWPELVTIFKHQGELRIAVLDRVKSPRALDLYRWSKNETPSIQVICQQRLP